MLQYKIRTDVKQRYNSKVKIESILKEKTQSRTKSLQKRKLIVYRKSEKFYIDYSAAYALKLVSVRAIMLNDLQLFEIDLDTLENFQNNNELEIEYKEIEQDQEINVAKDELEEVLEELKSSGDYGIGVHGIDSGTILEKENIAQKISEEGLNIRNNSKTILSTSISLGTNEDSKRLSQDIREYRFGNGEKVSVVIAVPLSIKSKNGDKIFLGFPEENRRTASQQYEEHCILDRICSKLGKIPPEFILGFYYETQDGTHEFVRNMDHYSTISEEQKENLFEQLNLNMDEFSKSMNALVESNDVEKANELKSKMQNLKMNTYVVDSVLRLIERNQEKTKVKEIDRGVLPNFKSQRRVITDTEIKPSEKTVERKSSRRIIVNDSNGQKNSTESVKMRKRKLLEGFIDKTSITDLNKAKEQLSEGLERTEKDSGERTI